MNCEVCGTEATFVIQDVKEAPPRADADGNEWRAWQPDGPPHHYCDEHARGPTATFDVPPTAGEYWYRSVGEAIVTGRVGKFIVK